MTHDGDDLGDGPRPGARVRVVAVIRSLRVDAVMEALVGVGAVDVLIEQVRGYGRQKDHLGTYTASGGEEGFLPKVRLEFVASREQLPALLDAVCGAARTGRIGDGKLFMHTVEPVVEGRP